MSDKDGQNKILVEKVSLLDDKYLAEMEAKKLAKQKFWLKLPSDFNKDKMSEIKKIFEKYPGLTPVYLEIRNGHTRKIKTDLKILPNNKLKKEIEAYFKEKLWHMQTN